MANLPFGISVDFKYRVARGEMPGRSIANKYGKNPDIDTGSAPEDIWNGGSVYTGFPTGAAEALEIYSSDAADTSAGTGARTVEIYNLLDSTGAAMPNKTVTLSGTTPVDVDGVVAYYRGGSRMKILTAGSGGENAGTLTLRHKTTTANIFAVMPISNNQTAIGAYTVPLGKTLYIDSVNARIGRASGAAGSAVMRLLARPHGGVFNTVINPEVTTEGPYTNDGTWYVFTERTDIKWNCFSVSDNNTIVTAEFNGILVDD